MKAMIALTTVNNTVHNIVVQANDEKHLHNKLGVMFRNSNIVKSESDIHVALAHVVTYQVVSMKD